MRALDARTYRPGVLGYSLDTSDVVMPLLCDVLLQLAELRTECNSLAERLHSTEKAGALQQQELQRQLHSLEQLRERDLMHVRQQYQMLYQQFVLLQHQQSASQLVRYCSIYAQVH